MICWNPMVILRKEIPLVKKIKNDEKWLMSEKTGEDVGDKNQEVEKKVCEIIKKNGDKIRKEAELFLSQSTKEEYRLVRHKILSPQGEKTVVMPHKVFLEEDGTVCGISSAPLIPHGEERKEALKLLNAMITQIQNTEILDENDFLFADFATSKQLELQNQFF